MSIFLNRLRDYRDIPNSKTFKTNLYHYYEENYYRDESLIELSDKINIPYDRLYEYLYDYIQKNMLMSKQEFKKYIAEKQTDERKHNAGISTNHTHKRNKDTKLKQCFDSIIDCKDVSEITNIIANSGYTLSSLEANFILYAHQFTKEEKQTYYNRMQEYLTYHKQYIKEQTEVRKQEQLQKRLGELCDLLDEYMSLGDDVSLKDFIKEKEISQVQFERYLATIKKGNPSKHREFNAYEISKNKRKASNLVKAAREIGKYLQEGYEVQGEHRDFDLIDYFLITKYKFFEVYDASKRVIPESQRILFKKFKMVNERADVTIRSDIKAIYDEQRLVGVKFDEAGKPIPNTGRIITDDEKTKILDYLSQNRIPINRFTYKAALKKYLNGYILNDDTMILRKKNK